MARMAPATARLNGSCGASLDVAGLRFVAILIAIRGLLFADYYNRSRAPRGNGFGAIIRVLSEAYPRNVKRLADNMKAI
jgi:hypothetical protein